MGQQNDSVRLRLVLYVINVDNARMDSLQIQEIYGRGRHHATTGPPRPFPTVCATPIIVPSTCHACAIYSNYLISSFPNRLAVNFRHTQFFYFVKIKTFLH